MRYLLIGKKKGMGSILVRNPKTGAWYQKRIRLGVRFELDEEEMTEHIWRQNSLKTIQVIPVEEQKEEPEPKKESKAVKKTYGRKKKEEKKDEPWEVKLEEKEEDGPLVDFHDGIL